MSKNDNNIPVDPNDNIVRLRNIHTHMETKLERKEDLYDIKASAYDKLKKVIDEIPKAAELNEEELADASRREQILMRFKIEMEDLDREIRSLNGKLDWNERQQGIVEEIVNRSGSLTYKPFEDSGLVATEEAEDKDEDEDAVVVTTAATAGE